MTDKVQKIKEWISKTQDILMDVQGNSEYPEYEGAYHVLCNLDAYIDSLQEEPVFKVGDRISFKHCKENRLKIIKVGDKGYYCEDGTFLHFDNQYLWKLAEEPVSEDLK